MTVSLKKQNKPVNKQLNVNVNLPQKYYITTSGDYQHSSLPHVVASNDIS